jgi:ribA/ribD-fused uncharacterized protein
MINAFRGENRWLSNFHEATVTTLGLDFRTTEAAYQAWKRIDDHDFHAKCQSFKWAGDAMKFGRSLPIMTPNWHDEVKFRVMYDLNYQKFTRHPDLKEKLLATADQHLEEGNGWGDTVWGTCNGVGHNHLGKILMEVRKMIRLTT